MLKTFGLVYKTDFIDSFVFETSSDSKEEVVGPFIDTISQFRDEIRTSAQEKDIKRVFEACDKLRQETLPQLGVRLEDRPGLPTIWKLYDKNELLKELEKDKKEKEEKKQGSKTNASASNQNNKVIRRINQFSLSAKDWYATQTDKYSKFDENGLPTHTEKGRELTKEELNKLKKDFSKHDEKYKQFLEKQEKKK